jgi:CDP-4-dehydro-6-deoxyglucose reductase, E1
VQESIREKIFDLARECFRAEHGPRSFIPGQSYIPVTGKVLDEDDLIALLDSSLDLWLTTGRFGRDFERQLPGYFGRKTTALLVNSGSSANLLALSSLGSPLLKGFGLNPLKRGDEVITLAAGFPTTVNPIVQNGWSPVFIDIDLKTLNATLDSVKAAKGPKTRAVILAHTLGNPFLVEEISKWCAEQSLYLIEDCCDALGATVGADKKPVGSFGQLATVSFYPAHHITMGEGGAVIPKDGKWKRVAESLRDWGRDCWCEPGKDNTCGKRFQWKLGELPEGYDHKYTYSSIGYNLKATDMQAAIGLSQLKKLPDFVERRRQNWKFLYDGVTQSPLLRDRLQPVEPTPGAQPSWFGFPVHCAPGFPREKLLVFLEEKKVGTRLLFAGNIVKQPAYKDVEFRVSGTLENTDQVMAQTFWLGVYPGLGKEQLTYVLEQLEAGVSQL